MKPAIQIDLNQVSGGSISFARIQAAPEPDEQANDAQPIEKSVETEEC